MAKSLLDGRPVAARVFGHTAYVKRPTVSVVMPALNEAAHICTVIGSLAPQIEAYGAELVVAEGGSTDGTRELLDDLGRRYRWLRVIDNPERHPAIGLNRAISRAEADWIIRADAHTLYSADYLARCVEALEKTPNAVVGGRLTPLATTPFGRAVAAAMTSPWAIGPAAFHRAGHRREVDTVYLGAFHRSVAARVGGYRAFPSRAGEDADFCARARAAGHEVWLDPEIRSVYRPRESPAALARQSWRYGLAKAEILLSTGRLPSWRPLAPLGLIVLLLRSLAGSACRARLSRVLTVESGMFSISEI